MAAAHGKAFSPAALGRRNSFLWSCNHGGGSSGERNVCCSASHRLFVLLIVCECVLFFCLGCSFFLPRCCFFLSSLYFFIFPFSSLLFSLLSPLLPPSSPPIIINPEPTEATSQKQHSRRCRQSSIGRWSPWSPPSQSPRSSPLRGRRRDDDGTTHRLGSFLFSATVRCVVIVVVMVVVRYFYDGYHRYFLL